MIIAKHFEQVARTAPPRPVTGEDLMRSFGLLPGPRIGALLLSVEEARAAGTVRNKEDALAVAARVLQAETAAQARAS